MVTGVYRFLRDTWIVLSDGIYWLCLRLWRFNRGFVRMVLPGQSKSVHVTVAALGVLLEIVGLWMAAATFLAAH